jgi:hypothetical protein
MFWLKVKKWKQSVFYEYIGALKRSLGLADRVAIVKLAFCKFKEVCLQQMPHKGCNPSLDPTTARTF